MPAQARLLKKNRGGNSPVSNTPDRVAVTDDEHPSATLRDTEELRVEHPVGPPIPAVLHLPEEGAKVPSSSRRQQAGDVLEDEPSRPKRSHNAKGDEGQVATRVVQSESLSSNGERLAGAAEDHKVNWLCRGDPPPVHFRDITKVGHSWVPGGQDAACERLDLGAPSPVNPRHGLLGGADAAEYGSASHAATPEVPPAAMRSAFLPVNFSQRCTMTSQ
ncbi:MAG: hypothetical protein BIFFINMI_03792 [Phycisphaerae bacterium]|nr:hypothetical protein [Phycisphaerae bacterium]